MPFPILLFLSFSSSIFFSIPTRSATPTHLFLQYLVQLSRIFHRFVVIPDFWSPRESPFSIPLPERSSLTVENQIHTNASAQQLRCHSNLQEHSEVFFLCLPLLIDFTNSHIHSFISMIIFLFRISAHCQGPVHFFIVSV